MGCLGKSCQGPEGLGRLGCSRCGQSRVNRHHRLCDVIQVLAQAANVFVRREAKHPDNVDTQHRPGDVVITLDGQEVFLDVTITSPANQITTSRTTPDTHVNRAARLKWTKWNNSMYSENAGIKFVPLAVSAYGVWEEGALVPTVLDGLCRRHAGRRPRGRVWGADGALVSGAVEVQR